MTDPIKLSMLINADENRSVHAHENDVPQAAAVAEAAAEMPRSRSAGEAVTAGPTSTANGSGLSTGASAGPDQAKKQTRPGKRTRGRKKRIPGPPYICNYPHCHKMFRRSEHLARHQLNHNPKQVYHCNQPGCPKTFVRHDLLIRHLKRHAKKRMQKQARAREMMGMDAGEARDARSAGGGIAGAGNADGIDPTGGAGSPHPASFGGQSPVNLNSLMLPTPISGGGAGYTNMAGSFMGTPQQQQRNLPQQSSIQQPQPLPQQQNLQQQNLPQPQPLPQLPTQSEQPQQSMEMPASNRFTSVAQIIQQHSNALAEPANNKDFAAPNLLSWLFNDTSAGGQSAGDSAGRAGSTGGATDFLTGLNEFQMNNGGQSFFITDGFEEDSPGSSIGMMGDSTEDSGATETNTVGSSAGSTGSKKRSAGTEIRGGAHLKKSGARNAQESAQASAQGSARGSPRASPPPEIDNEALYRVTTARMAELKRMLPELKAHPDFTAHKMERALRMYWRFFHPRFPMLHRPSFDSRSAPALLLLSMMLLGIKLAQCVDDVRCSSADRFVRPKELADGIALPLRWLIFASPEFQPPAKLWIIQSLLMLEFYEKNCTTRQLHERAHLHHGTTIQLLRRSPTLGGSPHKVGAGGENNGAENGGAENSTAGAGAGADSAGSGVENAGAGNWCKWIEIESMKRATFMCFYMDAIDAISFGHQMLIYAHQIQMTMPVQDEVWESNLRGFRAAFKRCARPRPFLLALKSILNGVPERTNSFGKKVLLAGLSAIMFQIQQRDMQLMFGLDQFGMSGTVRNWRELLTAAFCVWRNDVGGSCCSARTAIDHMSSMANSRQFSPSDTRCKCITYHMAHVYMSISHYDLFIVAGAPWRMNVKPSSALERAQIERRVRDWSSTRHSKVCVVQCYLLLFEMFLSPQDSSYEFQYDYSPDQDLFFRSYVIGLCTLVLWCYTHARREAGENLESRAGGARNSAAQGSSAQGGAGASAQESTAPDSGARNSSSRNSPASSSSVPEEDGYRYLKRIRNEFTRRSGGVMLHTWFSSCSGAEFYGNLVKWVSVLDEIPGKEHLEGLLELVGTKMVIADYTVVKEIGKLLLFCRDRCRGCKDVVLSDMYS